MPTLDVLYGETNVVVAEASPAETTLTPFESNSMMFDGEPVFAAFVVAVANARPFCGVVALSEMLPAELIVVAVSVITFVDVDAVTPTTELDELMAAARAVATLVAVVLTF